MHEIDQAALHGENFLSRSGTKRFVFLFENVTQRDCLTCTQLLLGGLIHAGQITGSRGFGNGICSENSAEIVSRSA